MQTSKIILKFSYPFEMLTQICFQVILQIIFNHIFVVFPVAQVGYLILKYRGVPSLREVPSIQRVILDFVISELFWEIAYYYFHRLLHSKYLYKHLHKRHHEWTAPFALVNFDFIL